MEVKVNFIYDSDGKTLDIERKYSDGSVSQPIFHFQGSGNKGHFTIILPPEEMTIEQAKEEIKEMLVKHPELTREDLIEILNFIVVDKIHAC